MISSFALCALGLAGCLFLLWLVSLRLRDASIVDIFWGLGFVLAAWITLATTSGAPSRAGSPSA